MHSVMQEGQNNVLVRSDRWKMNTKDYRVNLTGGGRKGYNSSQQK